MLDILVQSLDDRQVTKTAATNMLVSMHRTMHGQVVQALGMDVASGRFAPGEALPAEPLLCEQLGVSRGALREAVKALAAKGLLELRPRTGTRVKAQSEWNLLDSDVLIWLREVDRDGLIIHLTEVRELIEPGAAAFAAARATDRERADIMSAYDAMDEAAASTERERFTQADVQFHQVLLRLSHNPLLAALNRPFELALHTTFETTVSATGAIAQTLPLHRHIVEAIMRQDADAAENAMRTLIKTSAANFREVRQRNHAPPASESNL